MKYFNKFILLCIILFLTNSCKTVKLSQKETESISDLISKYEKQIESLQSKQKLLEKSLYIYKDSLIQERALKEHSSSIGRDSSFLETTYATSLAKIEEDGKLFHNIQNKDSIPTKIIYIKEHNESHSNDSTNINKEVVSDSTNTKIVYKDKEVIKEVIPFSSKIKYFFIGFFCCLIFIFIIWIVLKIKGIKFKFIKL